MSVGGVIDESEIRAIGRLHRRNAREVDPELHQVGVNNPLIMIDEIDKIGKDYRGDRPQLCSRFSILSRTSIRGSLSRDSFDLSHHALHRHGQHAGDDPTPLRDRMEVIRLSGYTRRRRLEIAPAHHPSRCLSITAGRHPPAVSG